MAARDLVLGVDASTTGCKAIVWDCHGNPIAEGFAPLEILQPAPGFYEQAADDWWLALCAALRSALQPIDAQRLAGLSIAHQRESFVLVGEDGAALRNAILWLDERSRSCLDDLKRSLDPLAFHQRTGKPLTGNLVVGKLAWLRQHEPEVISRTVCLLDTAAYLVERLTGNRATSAASADPTGLFDMQQGSWDAATLELLHLREEQLPRIHSPGDLLGTVHASASESTGLPAGLPVFAGLGDGQASALGAGIASSGKASLSLGTSVIAGTYADAYAASPAFRTMTGGVPGSYIFETVLLAGGYTLSWLIKEFLKSSESYASFDAKAAPLPPGAGGLVLLPYWNTAMNPYWDIDASGVVIGWRGNHRPEHLYRAALEGVGFELRLHLAGVEDALGHPIEQVIASGGGVYSRLWLQIIADILAKPVGLAPARQAASLGAAMLAAAGAGLHADVSHAASAMSKPPSEWIIPDDANALVYTRLYEQVYTKMYPALCDAMHCLAELSR